MEHTFFTFWWLLLGVGLGAARFMGKRRMFNATLKENRGKRSLDEWRKDLEKDEFYRQVNEKKFDSDIAQAVAENSPERVQHLKYQKEETLGEHDRSIKRAKDVLAGRVDGLSRPSAMIIVWWGLAGFVAAMLFGMFF
ncbi:hypothetical protein [Burkholderia vietnamiensis]|uniref:hypothetical protein n=1 Tax=Burkholderia vietnamiensis TaxID=60552 RepID=UPI001CF41AE1|nr:hypothetical protein [Burkholderia vietnamiensis]MCA8448851.1 hypothetical protein [Burkholderia vietnamiensis]